MRKFCHAKYFDSCRQNFQYAIQKVITMTGFVIFRFLRTDAVEFDLLKCESKIQT